MVTAAYRATSADAVEAPQDTDDDAVVPRHDPWVRRAAVLLPAALMLCLGLVGLDRHSVWRDEAASLVAARRTLPELWTMLGHVDGVHALYYVLLHGWLQLGTGEVWARVPSVLAMTAAAALVAVLGARVVSAPVGLVAGLLFAVNPTTSYYAQEARSTALVAAVALLATWFLLRAQGRRTAWWVAYGAACVVLVALNLLALLVPLALAVTLVWWHRSGRTLLRWAVATAPAVLVALALAALTRRQPYQIGWIPRPSPGSVRELAQLALGPTTPLVLLVGLLVLVGILPTRSLPARRMRALALPLLVVPPAVLLAVSFVQPIFVPRYVVGSVPAAALLAAVGVRRLARAAAGRTRRPALVLVAGCAVLVVSVAGIGAQRLDRTAASRPDDLAGAAAIIASGAHPGDGVVFLPDNRRLVALAYPDDFAGVRDVALVATPERVGNLTGRPLPLPAVLAGLSASSRVWAVGRPGLTLLPAETDARAELDLLDKTFVPVEHTGTRGVGITLYVRRPASS